MPTFTPSGDSLTGTASVFDVCRFDRTASGDDRFTTLPNIICASYHFTEGTEPPSAQFLYILDDADPSSPFPRTIADLWPLGGAGGDYVVEQDDELLVYETDESGERVLRFDGFADLSQANLAPGGLAVSFAAVGVHKRLWDSPLWGAWYRDADDPKAGGEVQTDLPLWFNPAGKGKSRPNRTPTGYDQDDGATDDLGNDSSYPLFLDAGLPDPPPAVPPPPTPLPPTPDFWDLGDFVRYLFRRHNTALDPNGKPWVDPPVSPSGLTIDGYLQAAAPLKGEPFMDLADPSTYTLEPIRIRSFDVTGKALMEAVAEQLNYFDFHVFLNTREDPDDPGAPINEVVIYRTDGRDGNAPKSLFYPEDGAVITDGVPDFEGMGLALDATGVFNEVEVETAPVGYEVSVILGAGFKVDGADAASPNKFIKSALATATADVKRAYREFILDEAGLGHWDFDTDAWVDGKATDLDDIFGKAEPPEDDPGGDPVPKYVVRLRECEKTLFTLAEDGRPKKPELAISRDYTGDSPGLYDADKDTGDADWQSLGDSGWKLLHDRVGIEITADKPDAWALPKSTSTGTSKFGGDVVRVVQSLANPGDKNTRFWLRLTCVIRGDHGIDAVAKKREASPTEFTIRRVVDSREHWQKQIVSVCGRYNLSTEDVVVRDDTDKAQAQADSTRSGHEFPLVAGSVTIPLVSHAFGVGDFIDTIDGKGLSLASNAGGPAGESDRYAVVVGFDVTCQDPQTTTLKLSDRRAEAEGANHGFGRSR